MFRIAVDTKLNLRDPTLSAPQWRQIGNKGIDDMKKRLAQGIDAHDGPLPPYANRTVYIPVVGTPGRAKSMFAGRASLSAKAMAMFSAPVIDLRSGGKRAYSHVSTAKQTAMHRLSSTARFSDRAAYKRSIGRSGKRDLYETGTLQSAIRVIFADKHGCVVSIDQSQARKAIGNMRWGDWYGVSPSSELGLIAMAERFLIHNLRGGG